jgi:hypothetical protein
MAIVTTRLLSLKLTLVLSTALLAGLLVQVSFSQAGKGDPCVGPSAPPPTSTDVFAAECIGEEGGSVKTQSPATEDNPHWTKVTVPPGFPGFVTIEEIDERDLGGDEVSAQGPSGPACVPSSPYTCLVSDITTTQTTTRRKPMIFQFIFDKSTIPPGKNIQRIRVYHDGVRIPRCDDERSTKIGYELEQGQESCHAKTFRQPNRDVRIVVLSIINGRWKAR